MSEAILITGVGTRLEFVLAQQLLANGYQVIGTFCSEYPQLQQLRDKGADLQKVDFYQQNNVEGFFPNMTTLTFLLIHFLHQVSCIKRSSCSLRFETPYPFRGGGIRAENSNKCLN